MQVRYADIQNQMPVHSSLGLMAGVKERWSRNRGPGRRVRSGTLHQGTSVSTNSNTHHSDDRDTIIPGTAESFWYPIFYIDIGLTISRCSQDIVRSFRTSPASEGPWGLQNRHLWLGSSLSYSPTIRSSQLNCNGPNLNQCSPWESLLPVRGLSWWSSRSSQ